MGWGERDLYKIVPFCLCRLNSSIRWGQISTIQRTVHGDEAKKMEVNRLGGSCPNVLLIVLLVLWLIEK